MSESLVHRVALRREADQAEWSGVVPAAGTWRLDIRYRSGGVLAHRNVMVNGLSQGAVLLPPAPADWDASQIVATLELMAGPHGVTVSGDRGEAEILAMELVPVPAREVPGCDFSLTNPDATRQVRQVMDYLRSIHGRAILTGQHTGTPMGPEIRYLDHHVGRRPALRGFDFLGYSAGVMPGAATLEGMAEAVNNEGSVEEAIRWWRERQGLVTFCWHWYSPVGARAKGFYTQNTTFDLEAALAQGGEGYEALLKDMDIIAAQLARLRDAGVPVLWRPLHEADGGWFWWGAKGAGPYLKLYRLMHERYTSRHQLHNLIWVWNAPSPGWYPGDDVVDIASIDTYAPGGNHGPLTASYDLTLRLAGGRKPVALAECGPIPDPDELLRSRTPWLWFMAWGGMSMDIRQIPLEHQQRVYHHPQVVTSDRLPRWLFE